ncbi:hypothetical protein [Macrococcus equi]|uniref:hypothetical protein n=1 Tax=Macrococcus equi TaxID=3395462 RepID=UPI0039BE47AC
MNKIEITEEHYNDLVSNAAYRNEFSKFIIFMVCIVVGFFLGIVSATLLYMSL